MALHRGPDVQAAWSDGQIGLAHCMLYTTPESLSEQLPIANGAGSIVLTADARIDNRNELLAALGRGDIGYGSADSQLLLAGYERWGEAVVDRLVGDFAFAVWDARARRLFCAVDQLGAGQLYYVHRPHRFFACGSEIKALVATDDVALEIDEIRLGESLAWMRRPPDSTIFKGILKLPPAHAMSIEPAGLKLWRYWTLEPSQEATALDPEACTERFLDLFTEAVRCRIRSVYPVGFELSGGLDSSFVTGMARSIVEREGGPDLKTYSNVYDHVTGSDERHYIRQVLASGGFESHFIQADQYGPLSTALDMYDYLDDGRMGVGGTYRRWHLFKTAKQTGARVLLTGIDGDTTVSHGREYFAELAAEERWEVFAREAELYVQHLGRERESYDTQEGSIDSPMLILQKAGYPYLYLWAVSGDWRRFARSAKRISSLFPVPASHLYRRFWRDLLRPSWLAAYRGPLPRSTEVHPIVDERFAMRIDLAERLEAYRRSSKRRLSVRGQQLNRFRIDAMASELDYLNQFAAAHSLEARHPFMDIRLVRFCLGMHPSMSLNEGWSRAVMRWAMKGHVPEAIRWRTSKSNLAGVFDHGLFEIDGALLAELALDLGPMKQYVNTNYLLQLISERAENNALDFTLVAAVLGNVIWLRKMTERQELAMIPA